MVLEWTTTYPGLAALMSTHFLSWTSKISLSTINQTKLSSKSISINEKLETCSGIMLRDIKRDKWITNFINSNYPLYFWCQIQTKHILC